MVVFDELRVTKDASAIIISARVRHLYKQSEESKCEYDDLFENVLITDVYLLNEDDITKEGGCDISVTTLANSYINRRVFHCDEGVKEVREMVTDVANLNLDLNGPIKPTISIGGHVWFVYVVTNIEEAEAQNIALATSSCEIKKNPTLGITMDMGDIYDNFMANMKELNRTCQIPSGMIDEFLRYKAMTVAFDCGHCMEGIKYFNTYFKDKPFGSTTISNCGCNG